MHEILDFIKRRFSQDNNWLTGNCYYFAIILKDRFPQSIILYDVISGHFVVEIDHIKYDWGGVVPSNPSQKYVVWNEFEHYDVLQKQRIIRDCVL